MATEAEVLGFKAFLKRPDPRPFQDIFVPETAATSFSRGRARRLIPSGTPTLGVPHSTGRRDCEADRLTGAANALVDTLRGAFQASAAFGLFSSVARFARGFGSGMNRGRLRGRRHPPSRREGTNRSVERRRRPPDDRNFVGVARRLFVAGVSGQVLVRMVGEHESQPVHYSLLSRLRISWTQPDRG